MIPFREKASKKSRLEGRSVHGQSLFLHPVVGHELGHAVDPGLDQGIVGVAGGEPGHAVGGLDAGQPGHPPGGLGRGAAADEVRLAGAGDEHRLELGGPHGRGHVVGGDVADVVGIPGDDGADAVGGHLGLDLLHPFPAEPRVVDPLFVVDRVLTESHVCSCSGLSFVSLESLHLDRAGSDPQAGEQVPHRLVERGGTAQIVGPAVRVGQLPA